MTGLLDLASMYGAPSSSGSPADLESVVHASLSEPRWQGALLIGPPGIGKTRTLEDMIERFSGTFHIERLLCTEHLSGQPYGSLQPLVTDDDDPLQPGPLTAFGTVARALSNRAGECPVLMVIDNCDRIDELSASLVAQLVRERVVSLLAATDTSAPPVDLIAALWLEKRIQRIDLTGLDRNAAKRLLERNLGGRVSPRTIDTLSVATDGNPQLLIDLALHQRERGNLELREGFWLLNGPLSYRGIKHVNDSRLTRLDPAARDLVLTIALVEALPMPTLLALADVDVISDLLATGLLRTSPGPLSTVSLAEPALSEMLAHSAPPVQRLRLFKALSAVQDPRELPPASHFGFARCAVWCHTEPEPWLVASGAAQAFDRGDVNGALDLAAHGDPDDVHLQLHVARCLRALGRTEELDEVLRPLDRHPDPDVAEGALIIRLSLADPFVEPPSAPPWVQQRDTPQLRLALSQYDMRGGRYRVALDRCAGMRHDLQVPPPIRAAVTALQAEAMISLGSVEEGLAHAARSLQMLELSEPTTVELQSVFHSLYCSFQLAGAVEQTEAVIETMRSIGSSDSGAQVILGVEALRRGRVRHALTVLSACTAELRHADPLGLLGLAEQARRLSHRIMHPEHPVLDQEPHQPAPPRDWLVEATARLLAMGELAITDRDGAAAGMLDLARAAEANGGLVPALHAYIQAANHGREEAVEFLAALPASEGAPILAFARTYGMGLKHGSIQDLINAANLAESMGDLVLAMDVAESAAALARGSGKRPEIRMTRTRSSRAVRLVLQARGLQRPAAPLSSFEREVAEAAAAGATSKQLGARFHLSPRTVEWHLDKIYQRLHVSSRSELRRALDEDRGTS